VDEDLVGGESGSDELDLEKRELAGRGRMMGVRSDREKDASVTDLSGGTGVI